MSTDIEICSNALLLIGDDPITSFSDNSAGEIVSSDFYNRTKNEVLCHYPWAFAKKLREIGLINYGYAVYSGVVGDRVDGTYVGGDSFINDEINIGLMNLANDYILIGDDDPFDLIDFKFVSGAGENCILEFYYYKAGVGWTALSVIDNTTGFTTSGEITFVPPAGWDKTDQAEASGDITDAYYIKIVRTNTNAFCLPEEERFKTRNTNIPSAYNFSYAWKLPKDLLRLWAIYPESLNFTRIGNKIYSNQKDFYLEYIWTVTEAFMPEYFVTALEYKLASKFAKSITESSSTAKEMYEMYLRHVSKASNIDSQEHPQKAILSQPFSDVRLAGFSTSPYGVL